MRDSRNVRMEDSLRRYTLTRPDKDFCHLENTLPSFVPFSGDKNVFILFQFFILPKIDFCPNFLSYRSFSFILTNSTVERAKRVVKHLKQVFTL